MCYHGNRVRYQPGPCYYGDILWLNRVTSTLWVLLWKWNVTKSINVAEYNYLFFCLWIFRHYKMDLVLLSLFFIGKQDTNVYFVSSKKCFIYVEQFALV